MKKKIGQLIEERVRAEKMEVTAFAKAINKERSNAYDIFKRDNIDIMLLKKIGQVLDYDFFQDLLAPETKQMMMIKRGITKKVLIEIELTEDEINFLNIEKKLINIK
ncbi:MAG: hypothetical protein LBJ72_08555 [Dysgonamonadaceae bacterium]|jgi:hypothetical protein|nr:hypothetical protein [Dysgonamonadaceae bacterium]